MARTAKGERVPFSLYLYRGDDLEGQLAKLLEDNKRRQALMRDYILLGYACAQQGMRLDANQQGIEGVVLPGAVSLPIAAQPAVGTAEAKESGSPKGAETNEPTVGAAPKATLTKKYGNLI